MPAHHIRTDSGTQPASYQAPRTLSSGANRLEDEADQSCPSTRVCPKVFGLAAWSENCKRHAFCHYVQLYRYFMSQSNEFCRHNPLCCFSTSVCCCYVFRYRLGPETFGYTLVECLHDLTLKHTNKFTFIFNNKYIFNSHSISQERWLLDIVISY
jgi:hypothetical protein